MSAEKSCPNLEGCPIFAHFRQYAIIVYQEMYCLRGYRTCERYKLKADGKPVPDDLMPYGGSR